MRPDQADEAKALLAEMPSDLSTAEPANDDAHDQPIVPSGEDGTDPYIVAALFNNARDLVDHAAVLGSAHVDVLLPRMVPPGSPHAAIDDGTPGRFKLRVRQSQLARARTLLAEVEADDAADGSPRCPKCGSWTVRPFIKQWGMRIWSKFFGVPPEMRAMRCFQCDYVGPLAEFEPAEEA